MDIVEQIAGWGLTSKTQDILAKHPDITESLLLDRSLPPFPNDYVPEIIDFLLDDVRFITIADGKLAELKSFPQGKKSDFLEIRIDGECGLFLVNGEAIINRLKNMLILQNINFLASAFFN